MGLIRYNLLKNLKTLKYTLWSRWKNPSKATWQEAATPPRVDQLKFSTCGSEIHLRFRENANNISCR